MISSDRLKEIEDGERAVNYQERLDILTLARLGLSIAEFTRSVPFESGVQWAIDQIIMTKENDSESWANWLRKRANEIGILK